MKRLKEEQAGRHYGNSSTTAGHPQTVREAQYSLGALLHEADGAEAHTALEQTVLAQIKVTRRLASEKCVRQWGLGQDWPYLANMGRGSNTNEKLSY